MSVFRSAAIAAAVICFASTASADDKKSVPPQPPAAAYQACDGLGDGDEVAFSMVGGKEFHGFCRVLDGRLVAMPEDGELRRDGQSENPTPSVQTESPRG